VRRAVAQPIAILAVLALLSACAGGPPKGSPSEGPRAAVQQADRSDVGFVENLLAKEGAGEWTRGEGLVATLKLFAGELEAAEEVLRHPELIWPEGTGIIEMAHDYLEDGPDAEAKSEITRLLDLLVFSNDELEAMAGIQPATGLLASTASLASTALLGAVHTAQATEENCQKFFQFQVPPGVHECLEFRTSELLEDLYPGQYRIFVPAASLPQAGWTEHQYELGLQAMEDSVKAFKALGEMPAVNMVFSVSGGPLGPAGKRPLAGAWAGQVLTGEPCGIAIFTGIQTYGDDNFRQVIAHEMAHCLQSGTFPRQRNVHYEFTLWLFEGLADYLANVVYPTATCGGQRCDLEWGHVKGLPAIELATTLFDRSYENTLFFQYLYWFLGDAGIFELVRSMPTEGERAEQEAALGAYAGMDELYHGFARAMTDGAVDDTGGGVVPYVGLAVPLEIDGLGTPFLDESIKPFGVTRWQLTAADGKQVTLEYRPKAGARESARPPDSPDWGGVPGELPYADCDSGTILLVTSTKREEGFELHVPDVQETATSGGPGGSSLEGDWIVDNTTIAERVKNTFPQQTVDHYGGEIRASFRADGTVEVEYDGFEISGHSDTSGFGDATLHTELTFTRNAQGTDTYEVKNDYIFYGNTFEDAFVDGTMTIHSIKEGFLFKEGGYQVAVDEDVTTTETEGVGWELFGAAQRFDLQCNGKRLRFLGGSSGEVVAEFSRR
jgi:hypothetical protein